MPRTADRGFDAAVVDTEDRTVALVQVKADPAEGSAIIVPSQLARFPETATYFLAIDPNSIWLFRPEREILGEPIVRLDTRQVLQHYDPDFPRERVFESYLVTLVEAWLRDLAYHWKSENPPGAEELRKAGLLEKLEGGTTLRLEA